MKNILSGTMIAICFVLTADIIGQNVPNGLWYYIDLYLPF